MSTPDHKSQQSDIFPQTRWSLVLTAATQADEPAANLALGELCQMYWQPIYVYVRGRGWNETDAQDLTQEFFARLLSKGSLGGAEESRGKLRAYLLGAAKNFLADEYRKMNAQKRGGGAAVFSIDHEDGEQQFASAMADWDSPEKLFERSWARTLIDGVVAQMAAEYSESGKGDIFEALEPALLSEIDARPQRALARELGMSLAAIKVTVFRLRQKFREMLEKEIAHTLEDSDELEGEVGYLLGMWTD